MEVSSRRQDSLVGASLVSKLKVTLWRRLRTETSGNGMLEYALVLALVATGTATMLSGAASFFAGLLSGPIGKAAPYFMQ